MITKQLPKKPNKKKSDKQLCHAVPFKEFIAGGPPWKARCGALVPKEEKMHGSHCDVCRVCADLAPIPHP